MATNNPDTNRWIKKFENDGVEVKEKGAVVKSQADQYGRMVKDADAREELQKKFSKEVEPSVEELVQTIAVMRVVDTSDVDELKAILKEKEDEKAQILETMENLSQQLDQAILALEATLEG